MKRLSERDLQRALRAEKTEAPMRSRDDFWSDFKARARLRSQASIPVPPPVPVMRWALMTATAAVFLVLGVLLVLGPMQAPAVAGVINSVEVVATHSAVLIIDDETADYAMVWVMDMDTDTKNGGST